MSLLALPLVFRWISGRRILADDDFNALPETIRVFAALAILIAWLGGVGFLFYRAYTALDAKVSDVRSTDERAPVVLFRSFKDDHLLIPRLGVSVRGDLEDPSVVAKYRQADAVVSFEEVIERQVRDYAPLIAVGRPGVIRRGAAIREHFSDDHWQRAVADWMRAAEFIVVIASSTPGLRWELNHIIARGQLNRLVVVVPPGNRRTERWQAVTDCFADTPWHARLTAEDPEHVLALHWTSEERAIVLCSRSECDRDYEIALHLFAYGFSLALKR